MKVRYLEIINPLLEQFKIRDKVCIGIVRAPAESLGCIQVLVATTETNGGDTQVGGTPFRHINGFEDKRPGECLSI